MDGTIETPQGNGSFFETTFFDTDYRSQAAGVGMIWFTMTLIPHILWALLNPGNRCNYDTGYCDHELSAGAWHAWSVMKWGNGLNFGITTIFWLLGYIRNENRNFQKFYFRAIAWSIPLSWVISLWVFVAFLIGVTETKGNFATNSATTLIYLVFMAGFEAIAWWKAPDVVSYYKWNEQDWWNYSSEETD